jgi:putative transposase
LNGSDAASSTNGFTLQNIKPPPVNNLSDSERSRALSRHTLLRPFLEGRTTLAALARREGVPLRTARRWVESYRKHGLAGLVRKPRGDKGKRSISLELQHAIEGMTLEKPPLSVAVIYRDAVRIAKTLKQPPPKYHVVYSIVRQVEPGLLTLAHEGSKGYKDKFDLLHRTEAEGPNAIWQADHHQLKIFVKDNDEVRKPWLTVIQDDYSRAVAGYSLSLSAPSAIQTALALRQAIWRKPQPGWDICGIPQILYTDHGSDFTSQHMEQAAADLKIRLIFSTIGEPRGRGKIERFFKSITQVLLPHLPGYCPRANKAVAVLTLSQLAAELERYLIHQYNVTPHSAHGKSPKERWAAGGFLPHMPTSLDHLDLFLLTVPRTRIVHQDGIRFSGFRYLAPTLAAYVGESVLLRYDPRDMAEVRVFHHERFLCRAICQELSGQTVPLREITNARNQRRRELRETLDDRRRTVDSLLEARRWSSATPAPSSETSVLDEKRPRTLKRYRTE